MCFLPGTDTSQHKLKSIRWLIEHHRWKDEGRQKLTGSSPFGYWVDRWEGQELLPSWIRLTLTIDSLASASEKARSTNRHNAQPLWHKERDGRRRSNMKRIKVHEKSGGRWIRHKTSSVAGGCRFSYSLICAHKANITD